MCVCTLEQVFFVVWWWFLWDILHTDCPRHAKAHKWSTNTIHSDKRHLELIMIHAKLRHQHHHHCKPSSEHQVYRLLSSLTWHPTCFTPYRVDGNKFNALFSLFLPKKVNKNQQFAIWLADTRPFWTTAKNKKQMLTFFGYNIL